MTGPESQVPHHFRTLGIHPISRGFGWVVCEGPFRLVEAGLCTPIRGNLRLASIREFERLLARFRPAEVVLESFDEAKRAKRARRLGLDLVAAAADRGLYVEGHSREKVTSVFVGVGAATREEIAVAVARHFPGLEYRRPPKRRAWEGEDRRLATFCAAAVVLAHFHNGATALLNDLRNAA